VPPFNATATCDGTSCGFTCDPGFQKVGTGCIQAAYLKGVPLGNNDQFGHSISISADGNTLAIGAPFQGLANSGTVYVFTKTILGWSQQAFLKASNPETDDQFGSSVALSADGSTLAVGAPFEDSGSASNQASESRSAAGAVYVFTRLALNWSQQAYVKASNISVGDQFGTAVSLSANGNVLAIGAPFEDSGSEDSGAVYVTTRLAGMWAVPQILKAIGASIDDQFGSSVSLSADGNTLAVGAPLEEDSNAIISQSDSGAAYIFAKMLNWSQLAYLKALNVETDDRFGTSVSLSSDGTTVAVGAPFEDSDGSSMTNNAAPNSGATYVFAKVAGAWPQQAFLKASNAGTDDQFGFAVSIGGPANRLAVGAPFEDSKAGACYSFEQSSIAWNERSYFKAPNFGPDDHFGFSVALAANNGTLAVSAPGEDSNGFGMSNNSSPDAGAVYVFLP
jgi:hypothetical protein